MRPFLATPSWLQQGSSGGLPQVEVTDGGEVLFLSKVCPERYQPWNSRGKWRMTATMAC